jgi:hypothetical protein
LLFREEEELPVGKHSTITKAWSCILFFEYDMEAAVKSLLENHSQKRQSQHENRTTTADEATKSSWMIETNDDFILS